MNDYAIIPRPASVSRGEGTFSCRGVPWAATGGDFGSEAGVFNAQLAATFGETEASAKIALTREGAPAGGGESFRLEIRTDGIAACALDPAGAFRGLQALRQIILSAESEGRLAIPCGTIEDAPRFPWRGLMLDCSRNFFSVGFIKKLLDALSLHHVSVFHWHLTDDQGWRLPVAPFPLLTEIGSVRRDTRAWRDVGGFYSEDDIREIVAHAAERHIEVVPEVDLPGHASAILAAYPELGCTGGPYRVEERFGVFEDVLCAGNDRFLDLAEAIFDVLDRLFPSRYVHIGGDEVPTTRWEACPKCQRRVAELGLDGTWQLQSWITTQLAGMLARRGKIAVGWDEVLENTERFPLPENVAVMSWRGSKGGKEAATRGRPVVMSPTTEGCYLDYRHTDDPEEIGRLGVGTVRQGLNLRPVTPDMPPEAAALVLGGQGNLWTEAVPAGRLAEHMIFPRICAIAEALWTADPAADRDIADFAARLKVHRGRLDRLGLNHYRGRLE